MVVARHFPGGMSHALLTVSKMAKPFASQTVSEILDKRAKSIAPNTGKANKRATNLLQQYLVEKNEDSQFEHFSPKD